MLASTTLNLASFGSQLLNSPSHNPTKSFLLPPNQPFLKSPNPISSSSFLKSRTTSVRTAVAAVDSSDAAVKREQEGGEGGSKSYHFGEGGSKSYHFVVVNAKFMLDEEEHFQELMGKGTWSRISPLLIRTPMYLVSPAVCDATEAAGFDRIPLHHLRRRNLLANPSKKNSPNRRGKEDC